MISEYNKCIGLNSALLLCEGLPKAHLDVKGFVQCPDAHLKCI